MDSGHMNLGLGLAWLAWVIAAGHGSTIQAGDCCPADLAAADNMVNSADLAQLLGSWGPCPACSGDLNGDGLVDPADLATLLGSWGPCLFEYPVAFKPEAEQIGLEMLGPDGPMVVPPCLYQRIERDLELIRDLEPSLIDQIHTPAWAADSFAVSLMENTPLDAYLCLNEYYQVTDAVNGYDNWWQLTLPGNVNTPALIEEYQALNEVIFAELLYIIGGDDFWVPTPLGDGVWRWEVDDGWFDCYDGCDCHRLYVFETDEAGNVTLIDFGEFGYPWCL